MTSFAVAFIVTLAFVPVSIVMARHFAIVANVRGDRWGDRQVPRIGGVAISLGLASGIATAGLEPLSGAMLVGGCLAVGCLGLTDDLRDVQPSTRLAVQATIGGVLGAGLALVPGSGMWAPALILLGAVVVPILANAANLVDNADGLAATLAVMSALALMVMAGLGGMDDARLVSLAIVGAGIGFLVFNLPRAQVFMGDVGSLSLGFALAAVWLVLVREVTTAPSAGGLAVVLAAPAAWAVQLGDMGMVFVTRLRRRASPFRGGVDHTSHRLMRLGLSLPATLAVLAGCALVSGAVGGLAAASRTPLISVGVILALGLAVVALEAVVALRVGHAPNDGQPATSAVGLNRHDSITPSARGRRSQ